MVQLRQLRYVVEVNRQGNHISAAAEALNTSQPGMSKQIQELELELGFSIFQRSRNRVTGLTDPGREVVEIAQRILNEVQSLKNIREDYGAQEGGTLTIATTHTHARYILPRVIKSFVQRHPLVRIGLLQGNPTEICEAVETGKADIAVGTETMRPFPSLLRMPCYQITRSLIAPKGHPIFRVKTLTLEAIAKYPMIAHDPHRSGRWKILDAFEKKGISPMILFNAVDADVGKTYVEMGLGIAVMATDAFDPAHDRALRARDASHLFEASTSYVTLRTDTYIRRFIFDFIELLAPRLTPDHVRATLRARERERAAK
ncbi:LysR substrate-binding domain-containing protein [Shinella yambaruensis]|uniref:Transcriptional regulator CysB n=1 Tax=Shinella yambaruensis TaxID=415996 RepID=A0ABQ5ZKJ1_9HYPH|nr:MULTISPECIES: LysR substrate-binding domain-containing protein [Shinella]MCJ8027227.1 LysR substrate-binding domain-containing protein [Shinella yambaruensis]MCU7981283.1 LysR substrate-binding domain-containing protein [Shinella yambaruensis]MCW5709249.1 LysR family transcriptional regulator [Shinella sp.]GLR52560.1 transcriptional regulator CysB [Shinella yambaruensis]